MDLEGLQTGLGPAKQVEGGLAKQVEGLEWMQTYCRTTMKNLFTPHREEDARAQISNPPALEPDLEEGGQIDLDQFDFEQLQPPQQLVGQPY